MKFHFWKFSLALVASGYFFHIAATPGEARFIDSVNLVFHEAGHIVFWVLGPHMAVMGGTIMQITVPSICTLYFWFRRQRYSASLVLLWVGQSLLNVSVYASDAYVKRLPLLGDDPSGHDWARMLGWFGAVQNAQVVGAWIRAAAIGVMLVAACGAVWFSLKSHVSDVMSESSLKT